jgi:hypothetical protein
MDGSGSGSKCSDGRSIINRNKISQLMFCVALPFACTVILGYIYVLQTNQLDAYLNEEDCYTLARVGFAKSITNNMTIVNFYLICGVISDYTVHWFSPPLLILLFVSQELKYDRIFPWSSLLVFLLSVATVILEMFFDAQVYCQDMWLIVVALLVVNLLFHLLFLLLERKDKFPRWSSNDGNNDSNKEASDPLIM